MLIAPIRSLWELGSESTSEHCARLTESIQMSAKFVF
jgi:hypothetical protein